MTALPQKEPIIAVGLIEDVPEISFELLGEFHLENIVLKPGAYRVFCEGELLCLTIRTAPGFIAPQSAAHASSS